MPTSNAGVRVGYRELIADTTTNRAELTTAQSTGLSTALEKSNQLLGSVMGQAAPDGQVHALDATAQNLISGLGAEQAAKLDKRTPDVFVSKLKGSVFFSGSGDKGYIRWADLGAELNERTVYSRTPALTFCLARYTAPAPKDKKQRKRREGPTGPQKLAEGVEVDELQQNEVTKAQKHRLNTLGKVIKEAAADAEAAGGRRAVNLFRVVLHPTSFSQTVENFFDLSFLVKEGWVRLSEAQGAIFVADAKPPTADDFTKEGAGRTELSQNILKLDQPTWRKLVARWCTDGAAPLLPSRGESSPKAKPSKRAAGAAAGQGSGKKAKGGPLVVD